LSEELITRELRNMINRFREEPDLLPLLILGVDFIEKGFDDTIIKYKELLGTSLHRLQTCRYLIEKEISKNNIYALIKQLSNCILNPNTYLKLLEYTINNYPVGKLCSYSGLGKNMCMFLRETIQSLIQQYSLYSKLYHKPLVNHVRLAMELNLPLNELYITRESVRRAGWMADLVIRSNNVVLVAKPYSGKSTHLFLTGYILLKKYGILPVTIDSINPYLLRNILVIDDLNASLLKYLKHYNGRILASTIPDDLKILEESLPGEKIVLEKSDIGKNIGVSGKTVFIVFDDEIYEPEEIRNIAGEKLLEKTDSLKQLHIEQYLAKNKLREYYEDIYGLLRRLITKYYYIRKYAPLIGFIIALKSPQHVTTRSVLEIVAKYRNAYGKPYTLLGEITSNIYTIPHPEWINTYNQLAEDEDLRDIFEEISSFHEDIALLHKSISLKIRCGEEIYAALINHPELLPELVRKCRFSLFYIAPIHFMKYSSIDYIVNIKNMFRTRRRYDEGVSELILHSIQYNRFLNYKRIIDDQRISKNVKKKIISCLDINRYDVREIVERTSREKEQLVKRIYSYSIMDKLRNIRPSDLEYLLRNIDQIKHLNTILRILFLAGKYDQLQELLGGKHYRIYDEILSYLRGDLEKLMSESNHFVEYLKAKAYLRIGDLDRALISINKAYIGYYNKLVYGDLSHAKHYLLSLRKLLEIYVLKGRFREAQALIDQLINETSSYGLLISSNMYNELHEYVSTLKNIIKNGKCISKPILCIYLNILVGNYRDAYKLVEKIIRRIDSLNYRELVRLGFILRKLLLRRIPISKTIIDKYLEVLDKYSSIPKIKYAMLSIIPLYIMRYRRVKGEFLNIEKDYDDLMSNYGFWIRIHYLNYLFSKGVYYVRNGRYDEAVKIFNTALKNINGLSRVSSIYRKREFLLRLWINIAKILSSNYSSCYDSLKTIISNKLFIKNVNAHYWFVKCLIGNRIYRTALEEASAMFMKTSDPINKMRFLKEIYIASNGISRILADKKLDDLIEYVRDLIVRRKELIDIIVKELLSLIITQHKIDHRNGVEKTVKFLIEVIENRDHKLLTKHMSLLRRTINVLSEYDMHDIINKLLSKIMVETRDPRLYTIYLDTLINSGRYREAEQQLKRASKYLSKHTIAAYKALILYHTGKTGKARKKAMSILGRISDPILKTRLLFIIGKAYDIDGKLDKSYEYYREIIDISKSLKRVPPYILGESHYRIGEYDLSSEKYYEALENYKLALRIFDRLVFENKRYEYINKVVDILQSLITLTMTSRDAIIRGEAKGVVCEYIRDRIGEISSRGFSSLFSSIISICK
jgi:hypothetical protein